MRYVMLAVLLFAIILTESSDKLHAGAGQSSYQDATYKFAISPPDLGKTDADAKPVTFFGPAVDGFAANVNVLIQTNQPPLEEYIDASKSQIEHLKGQLIDSRKVTVGKHSGMLLEYTLRMNKRDLHFLALAVWVDGTVYLITCTDLERQFKDHRDQFQKSLDSFELKL